MLCQISQAKQTCGVMEDVIATIKRFEVDLVNANENGVEIVNKKQRKLPSDTKSVVEAELEQAFGRKIMEEP